MGPVQLRILMQPAHWSQAERHENILREYAGTLREMVRAVSVQDADAGRSRAGFGGGRHGISHVHYRRYELVHAGGMLLPELVVEHEFGHQYWYGMVATNEFEDAWMDEGINSYTRSESAGFDFRAQYFGHESWRA